MEIDVKDNKIKVLVKPNSSKNEIVGFDSSRKGYIVRVKAVPDKGKANAELVKFLSKELGKKVEIVKGLKSREKLLRIR